MTSARILQLTLHQVRTYEQLTLPFDRGTTVLVGPNGVGKTNLLEACAVVATGASPRTSSELRLVRDGAEAARIAATIEIGDHRHERDVVLRPGRGKQLRVDGSPARTVDEYAAGVPAVTFLPERLLTIRGAPQRRRALVDQLASRLIPSAARVQREYTSALQQRNQLLRRAKIGHDVEAQLAPWTAQLVEHGTRLRALRAQLLTELAAPFAERFAQLTTLADASFEAELRGGDDLAHELAEVHAAERRRGSTLVGPHLDDVLPRIASRDVRAYGSAGEQRAALLALTFASRDVMIEHAGVEPIVLLDEPWSELDADRRRRLTRMLTPLAQVIVTSTEPPAHLAVEFPAARVLAVSCGTVSVWPKAPDTTS